nr:carbon-nitrogen hydrolase family protein [uncultured Gellertiella sp.]
MLSVAACQYSIDLIETFDDYARHLMSLCRDAADQGAKLLVLPEYSAVVLTGQMHPETRADIRASFDAMQPMLPRWIELCAEIARSLDVYLVNGSAPVLDPDGHYRNRSWFFGPEGLIGTQDKLIMTPGERDEWQMKGGKGVKLFETPIGKFGILICYDNEFPMLARSLSDAGADMILAPSCTEREAGYFRVRVGAQARALENQIAVLVSPTVGMSPWSPAVDRSCGRAALYVPSDYGMPANGVFAESPDLCPDQSRWMITRIDLAEVRRLRTEGQVATNRDWAEQFTAL